MTNNRRRSAWMRRNQEVIPPSDFEQLPTVVSGSSKWWGGCLGANGCVYGAPRNSSNILKIDPSDDSITLIPCASGGDKWIGCVAAPNGKIYFIPSSRTACMVLDTADDSIYEFAMASGHAGGVLHSNGKIYTCPRMTTTVYEIDPSTDTVSSVLSASGGGSNKWRGGFLGGNNKIYFAPSTGDNRWGELDPLTPSIDYITSGATGNEISQPAILAQNGFGYSIPGAFRQVIKLDPAAGTSALLPTVLASGANKWMGGSLVPNGKILGSPFSRSLMLEIDPSDDSISEITLPFTISAHAGLVLAGNGSLYSIPYNDSKVFKVSNVGTVTPSMVSMPTDVSTLASSDYNKYQNKSF
ncbi:hypothetical protein PBT90_20385 [Algoriphagus halophytocola]|uniref:hypothetical protein n=1 Tax=Algoriphagus halophytocola TaxID=2991499 RepID=UPI0022DDED8E|nr:hypothetical protein [Algoriphagus sp. TR-M9]WBL42401.1 hypothetical protein PBT90_16820 [Algoriphagus sp. TR-M9]WBL43088.1 hypothetical protein PBT90_20385 [Algoriphagus sp. TR-M9]